MIRRFLFATSLAGVVACSLLAPPGGYSGGPDETATDGGPTTDVVAPVDVVVNKDGNVTVPGSAGTLVVLAGSHDPVSAEDDPAWSADVWSGVLDDKGKVAIWQIEKSAPIVGPFDNLAIAGNTLITLDVGLGVNSGRATTMQSIGWGPGLSGDWKANRVDLPAQLDQPGRLVTSAHVITLGGFRTVTDDAGTNTFAVKEVHPAPIDIAMNKVGAFTSPGVSLLAARATPGAAVVNGVLYVAGGRTGGPNLTGSVEASTYSDTDAKLDGFTAQPGLMAGGAEHKVFLPKVFGDQGYVFVAGGRTDTGNTPTDVVQSAHIKADGNLDAWVAVTSLPVPLRDFGVIVFKKTLYILGGTTTTGRTDDVYSAPINADGSLGPWNNSNAKLPAKRADIVGVGY